jgi:predicted amidohydrolase
MASNKFRLACVQMMVSANKQENLIKASKLVTDAVRNHEAKFVMLPV